MPSTTRYKRGDIVLVPFPFTDLTSSKRRPALIVSPDSFNDQRQDVVLTAITSQLSEESALIIGRDDCVDGALPKRSVVKPAKLFTIHSTLVLKKICALRREKLDAVLTEIRQFF
jgi:mRNA-degrading endonuclease toxin of MazEF toxin-antitoxin module